MSLASASHSSQDKEESQGKRASADKGNADSRLEEGLLQSLPTTTSTAAKAVTCTSAFDMQDEPCWELEPTDQNDPWQFPPEEENGPLVMWELFG